MRRRQIQAANQRKQEKPAVEGSLLPQLKAQLEILKRRIHEISAVQSVIFDPRIKAFDSNPYRCRHCHKVQIPKGLSSHERWCKKNPNRGKSR
jgi:hypothetical protein